MTAKSPSDEPNVWIVAVGAVPRARQAAAGRGIEWCYFGTEAFRRARVVQALAPAVPLLLGEDLNRVAHATKQPFLDWIAQIGARQRNPVRWWGSTLASSSPLQTDVFLLVCYTQLLQEWVASRRTSSLRLVVVEDPWVQLTMRRQWAGDPRVVILGGGWGGCLRDAVSWLWKIPGVVVRMAGAALVSRLVAAWSFRRQIAAFCAGSKPAVLLYTWVHPHSLAAPERVSDPWLGRLEQVLSARGEQVSCLGSFTLSARLLRWLKRAVPGCLAAQAEVTLADIVRAVGGWFRVEGFWRLPRCLGWEYTPLVARELLREWGQANFSAWRLEYFAMRRLACRIGPRVKCVIYPFENQPWEKLFCLAWRKEAPHVKLVGYQHSWVPPLLLPYALGRGEAERSPLPDQIVVNSELNRHRLQDGGYLSARLVNGGALRHEYLYARTRIEALPAGATPMNRRGRIVLVAFPLFKPTASRLLLDLTEEFREPLRLNGEPVTFVLKDHPGLPLAHLMPGAPVLPPWIIRSSRALEELLPEAGLFLYVPSTSTWWVALLHGTPVLKYQTDLLDLDADLSGLLDGYSVQACSRATLRSSITQLLQTAPEPVALDPGLLQYMFGPVNERVWAEVVGGRGASEELSVHESV